MRPRFLFSFPSLLLAGAWLGCCLPGCQRKSDATPAASSTSDARTGLRPSAGSGESARSPAAQPRGSLPGASGHPGPSEGDSSKPGASSEQGDPSLPGQRDTRESPRDPSAAPSACAGLDGSKYVSDEKQRCGPPVDGQPAPYCASRLEFRGSQYVLQVTDMVMVGEYSCSGQTLRSIGSSELNATLAPDGSSLRLDGKTFRRQP